MPAPLDLEHLAFVRTLSATTPTAPTLCVEWDARTLAAHVVLRERSVVEMAARAQIPGIAPTAERRLRDFAAATPYETIIEEFAAGPPRYSPFHIRAIREPVNLLEYLVHHEDVRRGGDDPAAPRHDVSPEVTDAVLKRLRSGARLIMRKTPVAVELIAPSAEPIKVGRGETKVRVHGNPVELALVAFGRQRAAQVDYSGDPADVKALREAHLG
jgi:uncharacterized protein (TIGR03085 family)